MNVNNVFPCTKCGGCCRRIGKWARVYNELEDTRLHFPFAWDKSGKCEKLKENNECSVYNNRPLICNIDEIINQYKLNKEDSYKINIKGCNTIIKEDGLSDKFHITEIE